MSRCVIVGGAEIRSYDTVKSYIKDDDFIIACDCGIRHLDRLGVVPSLIVGDFDSHENPNLSAETIVLPREKDDTDSVFAVKQGYARGFAEFLLIGVFGGRMDHTLVNVYTLLWLHNRGIKALAVDDHSEFEIVGNKTAYIPDSFPYFSLIAVNGEARGVYIKNAKWELENGTVAPEYQYAASNEVTCGKTAEVRAEDGVLLLIKDR